MKINLIRHGMTAGNLEKRYIGTIDEPLCPEGISALIGRTYPACGVLICSPMKRCIQTAEILFPSAEPLIYNELCECDFGDFEGKNYKELSDVPAYQLWIDSGGTLPFPNGEDPEDFKKRCCAEFLRAVGENSSADTLTFVVHGGTIMSVMEKFALPHKGYYSWQCANGCGFSAVFGGEKLTDISEIK